MSGSSGAANLSYFVPSSKTRRNRKQFYSDAMSGSRDISFITVPSCKVSTVFDETFSCQAFLIHIRVQRMYKRLKEAVEKFKVIKLSVTTIEHLDLSF